MVQPETVGKEPEPATLYHDETGVSEVTSLLRYAPLSVNQLAS
jgi:hypothetical protein